MIHHQKSTVKPLAEIKPEAKPKHVSEQKSETIIPQESLPPKHEFTGGPPMDSKNPKAPLPKPVK